MLILSHKNWETEKHLGWALPAGHLRLLTEAEITATETKEGPEEVVSTSTKSRMLSLEWALTAGLVICGW